MKLDQLRQRRLAYEIMLYAPWDHTGDDLPAYAMPLHIAMRNDRRRIAGEISVHNFDEVLRIIDAWRPHLRAVLHNPRSERDPAVLSLLGVYRYWLRRIGIDPQERPLAA